MVTSEVGDGLYQTNSANAPSRVNSSQASRLPLGGSNGGGGVACGAGRDTAGRGVIVMFRDAK